MAASNRALILGSDPTWVMESLPYGFEEMDTLPPPIPPEEYPQGVDMKAMLATEDKNLAKAATVQDCLLTSMWKNTCDPYRWSSAINI